RRGQALLCRDARFRYSRRIPSLSGGRGEEDRLLEHARGQMGHSFDLWRYMPAGQPRFTLTDAAVCTPSRTHAAALTAVRNSSTWARRPLLFFDLRSSGADREDSPPRFVACLELLIPVSTGHDPNF